MLNLGLEDVQTHCARVPLIRNWMQAANGGALGEMGRGFLLDRPRNLMPSTLNRDYNVRGHGGRKGHQRFD